MQANFDDGEGGAEVPMAPLIDIVFLLLIFFLVTASLEKPHTELPIELAEAGADVEAKSEPDEMVIAILRTRDGRGKVMIDGLEVNDAQMREAIRQAAAENPDRRVRVDADRQAPMYPYIKVIDELQFQNLTRVGIRTAD